MSKKSKSPNSCPCGSGKLLEECCGPILSGGKCAETAEALMRSRYSAYTLQLTDYLVNSWHVDQRPQTLTLDNNQKWLGLKIKSCEEGQPGDDQGVVEFVARYKIDGKAHRLHEISRFKCVGGTWFYVDGELIAPSN